MTTATGCFVHSGGDLFLTIRKSACSEPYECLESLTATTAWVTEVDICSTDGEADNVLLQNNINVPPGENYAFLLTDENEVLQEIILDSIYNFENSGIEEQRVYGVSYSGELNPQIGQDRKNTTASECYIHSGDDLFIRLNKLAACTSPVEDLGLAENINVYPNPSHGNFTIDMQTSTIAFDRISVFSLDGRMVRSIPNVNQVEEINVENPGIYIVRFSNAEVSAVKRVIVQ